MHTHTLPTKAYTTLVPMFEKPPFSRILDEKKTFFNRNRWFWGPIKHPFFKQNANFFRDISESTFLWKWCLSGNICNCIILQNDPFFLLSRLPLKTYPFFRENRYKRGIRFGRELGGGGGGDIAKHTASYQIRKIAGAPGISGTFSPSPTSKETAN